MNQVWFCLNLWVFEKPYYIVDFPGDRDPLFLGPVYIRLDLYVGTIIPLKDRGYMRETSSKQSDIPKPSLNTNKTYKPMDF